MKQRELIERTIFSGLAALVTFHLIHYMLFCRYRSVPGKSHCQACGHRRICQKYHQRMH